MGRGRSHKGNPGGYLGGGGREKEDAGETGEKKQSQGGGGDDGLSLLYGPSKLFESHLITGQNMPFLCLPLLWFSRQLPAIDTGLYVEC